jgi:hypothetical protein
MVRAPDETSSHDLDSLTVESIPISKVFRHSLHLVDPAKSGSYPFQYA